MKTLFVTFVLLLSCVSGFCDYKPVFPSFEDSLRRYGISHVAYTQRFELTQPDRLSDYPWKIKFKERAEALYLKNQNPSVEQLVGKKPIPKVIHQIWLGSPLPDKYKEWVKTWQNWNGWEYRLWTDDDVKKMDLVNRDAYEAAKNYGERSDILRSEILYRQGGVYVDIDIECLHPEFFEFASNHYDFYVGMEPLDHGVVACNALIGAIPNHPILENMVKGLKSHLTKNNFTDIKQTISKTGPMYLSDNILDYGMSSKTIDIILPPTFFYPFTITEFYWTKQGVLKLVRPETVALHWWDGSWWQPSGMVHP